MAPAARTFQPSGVGMASIFAGLRPDLEEVFELA
jgi:hypothetical protein